MGLLQFFCTYCPCEPNATTIRTTPRAIVELGKTPEIYVNPALAQRQADGRRAGLRIRRCRRRGETSQAASGVGASSIGRSQHVERLSIEDVVASRGHPPTNRCALPRASRPKRPRGSPVAPLDDKTLLNFCSRVSASSFGLAHEWSPGQVLSVITKRAGAGRGSDCPGWSELRPADDPSIPR
jgi:hypothetical protein